MEHTKEPWPAPEYDNADCSNAEWWELPGIGRICGEANARRIVACVNACAEISTATLEQVGLDVGNELVKLNQQRDEHKADAEIAIALCQKAEAELIALRAAIAEAERQEPVAWGLQMPNEKQPRQIWTVKDTAFQNAMARWPEAYEGAYQVALYATPQPAIPAGWQPIETAPRDGTDVLIYTMAGSMYVAAYDDAFSNVWRIRNDEGVNARVVTHWMPLPAAPKPENSHD